MIEVRDFRGKLNFDDNDYRVPKGDYTDALNITRDAQGDGQDMVVSTIVGNQIVDDELPTGTSKVIGNFADKTRNRVYYCTWNSDGFNRISYYDLNTETIVVLIEDLTDTGGIPVLNFDPSWRINHIDIIYRDEDGDLFFWTDGLNPPSKINVKTAENGDYGIIIRSYLDVAKEPPATPPYCVYEENTGITVNNLNNKLFKFKYRFVYDDFEKSVTSAQSEIPIPKEYTNQAVIVDSNKNSSIFILMDSGPENVTKIEILGAESLGQTWSDFFLIRVLDKAQLGILNNNTAQYKFFNNEAYSIIPVNESIQPFDAVPQKAYTQSLLNGNVLDYAAITEGYNLIQSDYNSTVSSILSSEINQTALVVVYKINEPISALKIIVAGTPTTSDVFTISYRVNGVQAFFSINTIFNSTSYLRGQIATYFTGIGYTVYADSDFNLIVSYSPNVLDIDLPTSVVPAVKIQSKNSQFAYDWFSRYSYGVVYFDEKGRTNGVITSTRTLFQTSNYSEDGSLAGQEVFLPVQQLSINNIPPIWASYFEIVRTKNLSKGNFLYWVSDKTAKDAIPNDSGYQYAYISINTLTEYIVDNPEIKTLGYEFTTGDRIRFVKLYNSDGSTSQVYNNKDFQIVSSVINPVVNGITMIGQTIKIFLPSITPSVFDFGTNQFNNYLIELYTPSPNFSNNTNLYYEFGQKYDVGNPGLSTRYHKGMIQDQDPTQTFPFNQPALYQFWKGDFYFRFRSYSLAGSMYFNANSGSIQNNGFPGGSLTRNNSNSTEYSPYPSFQNVNSAPYGSNNLISFLRILNLTNSYTFRVKGVMKFTPSNNLVGLVFNVRAGDLFTAPIIKSIYFPPMPSGVLQSLVINDTFTVPAGAEYVLFDMGVTGGVNGNVTEFPFVVTEALQVKQGIIDPNFSDTYDSAVSPNGRPWIFDENAVQQFNPTLIRFGGEFQPGTNVNNINRFYEENFDVYDRSRGSIKKMFIEGRNQYVFQEFDVGVVSILTQIVRDTAGNPLSAESDRLLNKIVYPYIGQYGIGNVPESFAYGKRAKYFVDNNKGVACRLSADGITALSILYKANSFFVAKTAGFNDNLNTTNLANSTPTIYGGFDAFTNKYIIAMSEIDRDDFYQEPYTLSFLESRDSTEGFESFLSFYPENMGAINNLFITFLDGNIWTHNNNTYCNFYNNQYGSSISALFNDNALDKKSYLAIMQTGNTVWYCPLITSQLNSYGSTPQQTSLNAARFKLLEGQYNSAILRDANSAGGIINGDTMKGNYIIVKFQIDSASSFYYINTVSLKYINSPLNTR